MQWKWLFFEPIKVFQSNDIQQNKKQKTKRKESFVELKNI